MTNFNIDSLFRSAESVTKEEGLHFYPEPHILVWLVAGQVEAKAEAWGGDSPVPGHHYATMAPRQTTPGMYIIHSCGPYRTNTWAFSRIRWGTPLMVGHDGDRGNRLFYDTGLISLAKKWKPVDEVIPGFTVASAKKAYGGPLRGERYDTGYLGFQ